MDVDVLNDIINFLIMYNIADLNAMDEIRLKSIAESMGIKKVDALQQEDLVYKILDQQAIDLAAASTVEKKRRVPKEPKQIIDRKCGFRCFLFF